MSSRKVIDIANSLEFVSDYNTSGITGNNARISTSENGELSLYNGTVSQNSTTGTIVLYNGGLSINNTSDSESYTSGGAITIRGGGSIEKNFHIGSNLYVLDTISSGKLVTSDFTTGNINFTGNLYQNGSLYISSQWYSGTGGNLSYTDGNVGIGTTAPSYTLDVNGTIRSTNTISTNSTITTLNVTGLTAGNINFTGSLYQNGSLYISSQWTTGSNGNLTYNSGNVGIGTTAPNSTLDIFGNLSISGSSDISTISVNNSGDVLTIKNISANGNSAIQFQNNSGSSRLQIGFANANSSITNFIGTSYILSEGATSIKIAAGNKTSVPVIINASDNSVSITTTTDATDRYSGSLKVAGGAGIGNSLYVGDDVHVNRDLYVNGAINGAAASSSTFAYLTLTATDDAMNLSTGSLVTYGGITIQSTADAQSVTNGGSLLTEGGASIGKTLYVGDKIITDLVSTNNLVVDTVTSGTIATSTVNLGICNMYSGSFTPSNNNTTAADVVGLAFSNTDIRSFTVTLTASITATSSLSETFVLEAVQIDSGWDFYTSSYGDSTDIAFSITNSGQVQYTTPNFPGFSNAIFRYQVISINKTGSYVYPGSASQATLISNTVQIVSTEDSNIGTNNGALYIMGGCTIDKTMYSNKISTGEIRVTNASVGSLSISSNLTVAGTITTLNITTTNLVDTNVSVGALNATNLVSTNISSATLVVSTGITAASVQITNSNVTTQTVGTSRITTSLLALGNTNTIGNIFTTGGNVGIGTTSPTYKIDVIGSSCVKGSMNAISTNNDIQLAISPDNGNYITVEAFNVANTVKKNICLVPWGGNIGIGTVNPLSVLHVYGSLNTELGARIQNANSGSSAYSIIRLSNDVGSSAFFINSSTRTDDGGVNVLTIRNDIGSVRLTGGVTGGTLWLATGGNVGIGTTSPSEKLMVDGNIRIGPSIDSNADYYIKSSGQLRIVANDADSQDASYAGLILDAGISSTKTSIALVGSTSTSYQYMTFSTLNTERMRITRDGKIGVGTTNPTQLLEVSGGRIRIDDSNNGVLELKTNSNISYVFTESTGSLKLYTASSGNHVLLQPSGGKVGLGTDAPLYPLHVVGEVGGEGTWATSYYYHTSSDLGGTYIGWVPSQGAVYTIRSSNRTAAAAFDVFSDVRIKKNIQDVDDVSALDTIRLIQPKLYNYIDEGLRGTERVWGFIAQQVKSVMNYAVKTSTDFVPDIFNLCDTIDGDGSSIITLPENVDLTNVKQNTKLRLVMESGKYKDVTVIHIQDNMITIDSNLNQQRVFVYGREVDDLHTLNKDAIFTVAVAALQEVDRQLQTTKSELDIEKQQHIQTKQNLQTLSNKMDILLEKLNQKYPGEFVL